MTENNAIQPLSRFKVLDLTRARSGPTAVRQLADWGADVIKIEMPVGKGHEDIGGNRHGPDFQNLQRNKRSMTLNLKDPEGLVLFKSLVKRSDVIVENYRPDVKKRLGIDYESLQLINPRLVYGSISGFGQEGPYRNLPGFDQIAQGMGGLMSITGLPGQGPVRVGIPIADLTAGMYCAIGILVALLEREVSGKGQWVHTSLLESQIAMLDFQAARWLMEKDLPQQAGNNHPTSIPTGVFPTRDGHINIAASGSVIFKRLCEAFKREDWLDNPKFATGEERSIHRDELHEEMSAVTSTLFSKEAIALLNEAGVPCGPINSIEEVFDDPQVRHLGMAHPVQHRKLGDISILSQAVNMSRTPFKMRCSAPDGGEHTDEILGELDLSPGQIEDLRERGVI
ncbi:MAG: CoA transferase [SAR324 cluster bacterium]|nr:CoA transferase [SAR324 cluster bacterium]